jgi:hypothetical protein
MRIEQLDRVSSRSMKENTSIVPKKKEEKTKGETGNRVVREEYPGNVQYSTQT